MYLLKQNLYILRLCICGELNVTLLIVWWFCCERVKFFFYLCISWYHIVCYLFTEAHYVKDTTEITFSDGFLRKQNVRKNLFLFLGWQLFCFKIKCYFVVFMKFLLKIVFNIIKKAYFSYYSSKGLWRDIFYFNMYLKVILVFSFFFCLKHDFNDHYQITLNFK